MDRRQFVRNAGLSIAGAAIASSIRAQTTTATLDIDAKSSLAVMPQDFTGLSYESSQLADSTFFSSNNKTLIAAFRRLTPRGVLRLGGNLSDVTLWRGSAANTIASAEAERVKNFYEWRLVDSKGAAQRPAMLGHEGIAELGGFLRATQWKLLYGLNLGTGTAERAAEEAALVAKHCGDRLLAFQVGNEADLYGPAFRPAGWSFDHYWDDYQRYVAAVRARVPHAPFAGPDVATKSDWVTKFAERARGDAVLVSSHYYAMGPAGAPGIDAHKLLSNDARLDREMPLLVAAGKTAGVPYRMTEGNTCYHGGQPGVSDAFASALWAADYLLRVAQAGFAGVNLHGGGEGYYAPITGEPNATTLRPQYYGMLLAQQFAGAAMLPAKLGNASPDANAYAARSGDTLLLAVINKGSAPLVLRPKGMTEKAGEHWMLTAPSLDAKTDVHFQPVAGAPSWTVPAYSGALWKLPAR